MTETTLKDRDARILGAVVEEFVHTAEPVGSRNLVKKYRLEISPATVRNVMADLEEMGFLYQPHTSAGRQPTDRGYRYYVDHLLPGPSLPSGQRRRLRQGIRDADLDALESLLEATSRVLSRVAHQVGLVVAPRIEVRVFRHVDLVLLRPGRVLVILVTRSGVVHHRVVEAPEVRSQAELEKMTNYLNGLLEGVPLVAVRERILAEMENERVQYDRLLRQALELGSRAVGADEDTGQVYVGEPLRILEQPEFQDLGKMRQLFEAFERKGILLRILDRAVETPGVQVSIGSENPVADLQGCSVVATAYGRDDRPMGALGVIGPTRMPYGEVIALVEYAARLLGQALERL
ncbi:heat-inducible transcriptional repressor HrcA [Deferrisoma camini]|uniref:heat-inducible transcriptional repressor HrcA n=1 Tax=Deferrisoma camini TaxID=1035120 RepID=UPI00046D8353|nr:heat-inducible transcriptional repressor HrcA [Deferrisoma camini]